MEQRLNTATMTLICSDDWHAHLLAYLRNGAGSAECAFLDARTALTRTTLTRTALKAWISDPVMRYVRCEAKHPKSAYTFKNLWNPTAGVS